MLTSLKAVHHIRLFIFKMLTSTQKMKNSTYSEILPLPLGQCQNYEHQNDDTSVNKRV